MRLPDGRRLFTAPCGVRTNLPSGGRTQLYQLKAYSIENFSFGGLFFQDQIFISFRLTITSFLKEFSAMKHLNSVGFSTFFAKITDFVKMISKKWRINFFLNIWIGQSESLFRMTQSTSNAPIADVTALKLNSVLHNIGGRP